MLLTNLPLDWLPLADAVLKATLILAGAAGAAVLLRRASAALRHLVWTLALCSALAVPVLAAALPKWQLPLLTVAPTPTARVDDAIEPRGAAVPPASIVRRAARTAGTGATGTAPAVPASMASEASAAVQAITWPQAFFAIWVLGAAAILARMIVGLVAVHWLARRTQEVTEAPWLPMAHALAGEMGVTPRLRFLRSGRAKMPGAAGIFRPAVLMPSEADGWSESRLRVVLLHELAHVKRRDCLTHLVAQLVCAFYWFNPLAWMAAKRARTERERACDDLVIASGTPGTDYADQLLEIARGMQSDGFARLLGGASLAMAHRSQLEGRLIAILDPGLPRAGVSRARAAAAIALCLAAVAPLGALQPWTDPGEAAVVTAASTAGVRDASGTDENVAAVAPSATPAPSQPQQEAAPQPVPAPAPSPAMQRVLESVQDLAHAAEDSVVAGDALVEAVGASVEKALQDVNLAPPPNERQRQADPRTVAALTSALKDSDKEVRETAMQALVQLRDPSVFEPLVQALKDASPDVREQAAFGLGQMRDRRAVEPLIGALKDENASVREQAVFALGQLRERAAAAALIAILKDGAASVREQAAFALGQLRDPAAVDGLAIAVRDGNPSVREQAVFALSQIRDKRAVEPLISALKDSNAEVRQQAAFALGQIRDRAAVEALVIAIKDANAEVREQVVFALGQIRDPRAIDALTTALKDQVADVRRQAAFALGQLAR